MAKRIEIAKQVGIHRTGAAAHAVRLSEKHRVELIANIPNETEKDVQMYCVGEKGGNSSRRNLIIPFGGVGLSFGTKVTTLVHNGISVVITVGTDSYTVDNIGEEVGIYKFAVANDTDQAFDDQGELLFITSGETVKTISGGFVLDNTTDLPTVATLDIAVSDGRKIHQINRDNSVGIFGMSYSDARWSIVLERMSRLSESQTEALEVVADQTHEQIPNRYDRDNAGFAVFDETKDKKSNHNLPSNVADILFYLVDTKKVIGDLVLDNTEEWQYIKTEHGLQKSSIQDIYGIPLGPVEASKANLIFARLTLDGQSLIPDQERDIIRFLLEKQMLALKASETDRLEYLETVDRIIALMFKKQLGVVDAVADEAANRANGRSTTKAAEIAAIDKILSRTSLGNMKVKMFFTAAYGELVAYRQGICRRFMNMMRGVGTIPDGNGVLVSLNKIANGFSNATIYDPLTGFGLADHSRNLVPEDLLINQTSPLRITGYRKKLLAPDPTFRARKAIIGFDFELDISKVFFTKLLYSEQDFIDYYDKLQQYISNVADLIKQNFNWYTMHRVGATWDNLAVPLTPTLVDDSSVETSPVTDRQEQYAVRGLIKNGKEYFDLRVPANTTRISFGLPRIEKFFDGNLEPKTGYKLQFIDIATTPFIILEEETISPVSRDQVKNKETYHPNDILRKTIMDSEVTINKTLTGYMFTESDNQSFKYDQNKRTEGGVQYGSLYPRSMDFSRFASITEQILKLLLGQMHKLNEAPTSAFVGTVLSDNESDGLLRITPDNRPDYIVPASQLDLGDIEVGDRILGIETKSGKYSVIRLPITTQAPNVRTQEIVEDRFYEKTAPKQYRQIHFDDVNQNLLQALTTVLTQVNCMYIEPDIYHPQYPNSIASTTEDNNSASNDADILFTSLNGQSLYRVTSSNIADQDISVALNYPIPYGFNGFDVSDDRPIVLQCSRNLISGVATLEVQVKDSNNIEDLNTGITLNTTLNSVAIGPLDGTYTPGKHMRLVMTATVRSGHTVDLGRLEIKHV